MEKKEQINKLLHSIKDTIKSTINKEQPASRIVEEYEKLLYEYNKLYDVHNPKNLTGFIKGLLYYHNVENFAKITILYELKQKNVEYIDHCGDKKLQFSYLEIINNAISHLTLNEVKKIFIKEKEGLQFNLYLFNLNNKYIIATVASSFYFKISKFEFFCNFIKKIESINKGISLPVLIDYFNINIMELQKIIDANRIKKIYSNAELLCFNSIKMIFNNSAIATFSSIISNIISLIKNHYPQNSKVFILSFSYFLIIMPDDEKNNNSSVKMIFEYNEIPIPFKSKKINLGDFQSLFNLLDHISNIIKISG